MKLPRKIKYRRLNPSKVRASVSSLIGQSKFTLASETDVIPPAAGIGVEGPADLMIVPQTNLEDPGAISPTTHVGTQGPADSIMASQENLEDSIELLQSNPKPRLGRPMKEKMKLIEKATEDLWKLIHDLAVSLQ